MANEITIPQPDEIRQRIERRREEIASLKRILKLSCAATRAAELDASATEDRRRDAR
jgi:hypothetical protein